MMYFMELSLLSSFFLSIFELVANPGSQAKQMYVTSTIHAQYKSPFRNGCATYSNIHTMVQCSFVSLSAETGYLF